MLHYKPQDWHVVEGSQSYPDLHDDNGNNLK